MAFIDFGSGDTEFRCTARTLVIYEQEFWNCQYPRVTGDLIADVYGKRKFSEDALGLEFDDEGNITALTVDLASDNWGAELRALWAMLKTQSEIDRKNGKETPPVPSYREWSASITEWEPNMKAVSKVVFEELDRGLFRTGAAAS